MAKARTLLLSLALTMALLAAYANHFQNDFHFDDSHTVVENPFIRDLHNAPRFFTDPFLFSTMPDHATYRPIVSLSLAVDYWLGHGLKPFFFHLSSFLWLCMQGILLFFLFRRIMDWADPHQSNLWAALFAAACYGLHPAMAETVNYVIQRGDLYSTLGVVASLLGFIAWPSGRKFGLYLVPALLACLSKAPALIFPAILFTYILLFEEDARPEGWKSALRATLPALVVAGAAMLLLSRMLPPVFNAGAASKSLYRLTQPYVWVYYFKSFFLPTELNADTDWEYVSGPFSTNALVGFCFVAALIAAVFWTARSRRTRPIAFGIAWFILALLPTSLMPLAEVLNDHRMFFPFVGLSLAAVWGLRLALFRKTETLSMNRAWVRAALAGMVVVLVAEAAGTRARNQVWRTEESLWRDVVVKSPRNGRGLMNYGLIFMARGDYNTALAYFQRALPLTPNYWSLEVNLGIVNGAMRNDAEASSHFDRAISLEPKMAEPYFYYGRWLSSIGRTPEAAGMLETAVARNRLAFDARDLLMEVYAQQHNWPALDRLADETVGLSAQDATARKFLASRADRQSAPSPDKAREYFDASSKYLEQGKYADSIACAAKQALEIRPDYAEAYNNIAAAANAMRRWDDGIHAAMEAVRIKPDYASAKKNLMFAVAQRRMSQ